jgi:cell division protein FtsA
VARKETVIAALDIGTQKIGLVVADRKANGLEVLGVGATRSDGMRAGRVVDVEKATRAISVALAEAELMASCQIHQVTVALSGAHLVGTNSHGVAPIDNGEVTPRVAKRAVAAAQAVPLPSDRTILHLLCREYVIDDQDGIQDPIGIAGVRLQANLHVISTLGAALDNITKCCNKAGVSVRDVIAASLASAEAVLDSDEKDLGVAVVDIGAGTVDLAVFHQGGVVHSAVFDTAGLAITRDLAQVLETSMNEAESIKKRYGCAMSTLVDRATQVEVAGVGGRSHRIVGTRMIADIIQPRLEEIFEEVHDSIVRSGFGEVLTSGVVLTGGTAMMPGISDLARRVLHMPARVGEPHGVEGIEGEIDDSSWSTAIGLVLGVQAEDLADPWRSSLRTRLMPGWLRRRFKGATPS